MHPSASSIEARDRVHLERAVELGRRGRGSVHPNPEVGCVVVREGRVVGEGWHARFGGPHAEVRALEAAGEAARGATAFVSLEPCDHVGKTPPCSAALVAAGIARVVYGATDPGTRSGGGAASLRDAGVEVAGPLLSRAEARRLNPAFFHGAEGGRGPYVALKLALGLDGRIAARPGERTAVTGPAALRWTHRLRAGFDAILVGRRTAEVDDPLLTVRHGDPPRRPPARLVLDSRARLSPDARLLRTVDQAPVRVFVSGDAAEEAVSRLRERGAAVERVPSREGGLELAAVVAACDRAGLASILCEGGGVLASSLLRDGPLHRIHLLVAPRLLVPGGVPAFPGPFRRDPLQGWIAVPPPTPAPWPDALVELEPAEAPPTGTP